jgi:hypothetical protein
MAKKETKSAAAPTSTGDAGIKGTPESAAKAREARDSAAKNDVFTHVGDPNKKVAPQATVIINAVKAGTKGGKGITREKLIEALSQKGPDGNQILTTRQPVGRIVSYYQKLIQESGAVTITKGQAA